MSALVVQDRPVMAVLTLWSDAQAREWSPVPVAYPGWRWAGYDRLSWFAYRSGDDFAVSSVDATHRDRTLSLTGVVDQTEAVQALRWFLGWPE